MTELEKYQLINSAESTEMLATAIRDIANSDGNIQGRQRPWLAKGQIDYLYCFMKNECTANRLTRSYGIRQQAMYLKHYGI